MYKKEIRIFCNKELLRNQLRKNKIRKNKMLKKLLTKSFLTRCISGAALVLIALVTLLAGGMVTFAVIAAISFIGLMELLRVYQIHKTSLGAAGYLMTTGYYGFLWMESSKRGIWQEYFPMLAILLIMLLMAIYVLTFPKFHAEQVMAVFFGVFYVSVMLSYVYQIRMLEGGKILVWLVFLSSWICDTCAYLTGVTMGKRKLAPVLSPNKSVEGSVGGILGSFLFSVLFGMLFQKPLKGVFENPALSCGVVSALGAVVSQIGDLCASAIKRNKDIKDYGTLIPGHGGILDRFDSVIFVAPAIYYLCIYLGR